MELPLSIEEMEWDALAAKLDILCARIYANRAQDDEFFTRLEQSLSTGFTRMEQSFSRVTEKVQTMVGKLHESMGVDVAHKVFDDMPKRVAAVDVVVGDTKEPAKLFTKVMESEAVAARKDVESVSENQGLVVKDVVQSGVVDEDSNESESQVEEALEYEDAPQMFDVMPERVIISATVNSITTTQKTGYGSSNKGWRGGKATSVYIITNNTGAVKAVGKVLPSLNATYDQKKDDVKGGSKGKFKVLAGKVYDGGGFAHPVAQGIVKVVPERLGFVDESRHEKPQEQEMTHNRSLNICEVKVVKAESLDTQITEVLLFVQFCLANVDEKVMQSEFKRIVQVHVQGAATSFPLLPLTTIVVQDHQGISNVAPDDCPMLVLLLVEVDGNSSTEKRHIPEGRLHDYIDTLAAERRYSLARNWADLNSDTLLFDICCGTGTIAIDTAIVGIAQLPSKSKTMTAGSVENWALLVLTLLVLIYLANYSGITGTYIVGAAIIDAVEVTKRTVLASVVEEFFDSMIVATVFLGCSSLSDAGRGLGMHCFTEKCVLLQIVGLDVAPRNCRFAFEKCTYYFEIAMVLVVTILSETLSAVIATRLALGTRIMAQKNALLKKLPTEATLKALVKKRGVPSVSDPSSWGGAEILGCCQWWNKIAHGVATLEFDSIRKSIGVWIAINDDEKASKYNFPRDHSKAENVFSLMNKETENVFTLLRTLKTVNVFNWLETIAVECHDYWHVILARIGVGSDMYVLTLLIDVYSRRGCITEAYLVFISVAVKSIVLWNAMITGFSRYACVNESMILFEEMLQNGICLIAVMYISMLSACIHVGSIASGHYYFYQMTNAKNVQATVLHCSCMVVVLKRSAQIQETRELMENMSFQVTTSMWGPLLGVCRIHRDIKLAKVTAERLFELESENAVNHVCFQIYMLQLRDGVLWPLQANFSKTVIQE